MTSGAIDYTISVLSRLKWQLLLSLSYMQRFMLCQTPVKYQNITSILLRKTSFSGGRYVWQKYAVICFTGTLPRKR